jgi:hypothetical protein
MGILHCAQDDNLKRHKERKGWRFAEQISIPSFLLINMHCHPEQNEESPDA